MQLTGPRLRLDDVTAGRVDAALLLLPAITWLEAAVMMAASGVPTDVAARVLALPLERRPMPPQHFRNDRVAAGRVRGH